jgi:hypothetical protein
MGGAQAHQNLPARIQQGGQTVRSRNIKPGFFKNDELSDLSMAARLLFIGLWCMADKEGRLLDRPRYIKGELFPYDNIKTEPLLTELASKGFIVRYTTDEKDCIEVVNFKRHQNPHPNEIPSVLPAPGVITSARVKEQSAQADSLLLIPDSLLLIPALAPKSQAPEFDTFWSLYPKRVAKGQAQRAWSAALKKTDADTIIRGLKQRLPSINAQDKQFRKNPATWLNGECWLDEIDGKPAVVFSDPDESLIERALVLYRRGMKAEAQDLCPNDRLWLEVMRRARDER